MRMIEKLVCQINEEVEGAKHYAEKALLLKAEGDASWSNRYKEMANDEIKHAAWIHDYTVQQIDKLKVVYQAPQEMREKWEREHTNYVEQVAWIKQMLNM